MRSRTNTGLRCRGVGGEEGGKETEDGAIGGGRAKMRSWGWRMWETNNEEEE